MKMLIHRFTQRCSISLSVILCCMVLFLSGCAGLSSSTPALTPTPGRRVTPTATAGHQESSGNSTAQTVDITQRELAKAQQIMAGMSLEQKLGQLILVEYLGNNYANSGLQEMVEQQYVGGYMFQQVNGNFAAPDNVASNVYAFSQQAMRDAKIPLMIATDQEGGLVNRLYVFHGYLPSAETMAATGNPNYVLAQGAQAAKWMEQLGINTDLAPVVDVHTVDPPILETRMFGNTPQTVATYAGAYLAGLQQNGVAGCLKHFPGLGAISSDPHAGLPTVNRSMAQLDAIDLAPYKLMIGKDQPAMIMSTDVLMPSIDPSLPAELSPKAINGVLRGQLGYNGVVITDGLYMRGISDQWSLGQASVLSILAGDDIIEGPYTPNLVASVISALKQAIQQGKLTVSRIDQSVERILLLKIRYGMIK